MMAAAFALFCHFHREGLVGVLPALLHGLQQAGIFQGRKNIGYRLTNQVLGTVAKMGEEWFVTKNQLSVCVDKGAKRVLGKTHRCWIGGVLTEG